MTCVECNTMEYGVQRITEITAKIQEKLLEGCDFFAAESPQNFALGSYPFNDNNIFATFSSFFFHQHSICLNLYFSR